MKSEGILDEIEKIVDDAWDVEKKRINTHIDEYREEHKGHFDRMVMDEHRRHAARYRDQYMREIEKRTRWDSPYSQNFGEYYSTPTKHRHKCTSCQSEIEVLFIEERHDWRALTHGRPIERREINHFYCPKCRSEIRIVGKILEIRINMTE